jgi:hypothetical protein
MFSSPLVSFSNVGDEVYELLHIFWLVWSGVEEISINGVPEFDRLFIGLSEVYISKLEFGLLNVCICISSVHMYTIIPKKKTNHKPHLGRDNTYIK